MESPKNDLVEEIVSESAPEPALEDIATSRDSVYDAILGGTLEAMTDLVERVADTGATCMERDIEFAGQTWTVTVRVKN